MVINGRRRYEEERKEEEAEEAESPSRAIQHWLIRETFLPFITPPLINRGQVNSAICYFNDVSSYEINAADLDEVSICRGKPRLTPCALFFFIFIPPNI